MMDIEFSPSGWQSAGKAYEHAGTDLAASVAQHLSVLDVSQLGCEKGNHIVDMALSMVVPAVKEAFDQACRELATNMQGVGQAMTDTGVAYEQLESDQAALASTLYDGE